MAFNVEINESFLLHEQLYIKTLKQKKNLRHSIVHAKSTKQGLIDEEFFENVKLFLDDLKNANMRTFIYLYENCPVDVLMAESENAAMTAYTFVNSEDYDARIYYFDKKEIVDAYIRAQSDNLETKLSGQYTIDNFKKQCGYSEKRPCLLATLDRIEKMQFFIDSPTITYKLPTEDVDYVVFNIPNREFFETHEGMRYKKIELDQSRIDGDSSSDEDLTKLP